MFYSYQTPRIPGKEGKTAQKKEESLEEKKQGIPKKQGKEGQGRSLLDDNIQSEWSQKFPKINSGRVKVGNLLPD